MKLLLTLLFTMLLISKKARKVHQLPLPEMKRLLKKRWLLFQTQLLLLLLLLPRNQSRRQKSRRKLQRLRSLLLPSRRSLLNLRFEKLFPNYEKLTVKRSPKNQPPRQRKHLQRNQLRRPHQKSKMNQQRRQK